MKIIAGFLAKHEKRVVGLDILRSIAILLVMFQHQKFLLPEKLAGTYESFNLIKLDGVSIFFVLSGFLIGGILLKTITRTDFTRNDLRNFWIRRWFRTIPNYLLVLVALYIYDNLFITPKTPVDIRYFFFLQNFSSHHPLFFPEAWSLCIEEWFYLLFPAFCYILHRLLKSKSQAVLIAALLFLVFPLVIRIWKYQQGLTPHIDEQMRKVVLFRLDGLMYGVIAAYLLFRRPRFWAQFKYGFFVTGIAVLVFFYVNPTWHDAYPPLWFNAESIATFCLLPLLSAYKTTKYRLPDSFFIFISLISYSMYLLNLTPVDRHILPVLTNFLGRHNIHIEANYKVQSLLYWSLTIIFSWLLYRFYENPITNLRDKIKIAPKHSNNVAQPNEAGYGLPIQPAND